MRIRAQTVAQHPPGAEEATLIAALTQCELTELSSLLQRNSSWNFEQQAELHNWIPVLNRLDAICSAALEDRPGVVVAPHSKQSKKAEVPGEDDEEAVVKDKDGLKGFSERDVSQLLASIIRFSTGLLSNAFHKHLYASTEHVVSLLGAFDDEIAIGAVSLLSALASPSKAHRQPHRSRKHLNLARSHPELLRLLLLLSNGWGSRTVGLGLYECVTKPQNELPSEIPCAKFEYMASPSEILTSDQEDKAVRSLDLSVICSSGLSVREIFTRVKTEEKIPESQNLRLLLKIRQCVSFTNSEARKEASLLRLHALSSLLYIFSHSDVVASYFSQNPELVQEIVDLVRPTQEEDKPVIPKEIKLKAIEVLTAMLRDGRDGMVGMIGRQSGVLQTLGMTRSHGTLATLVRSTLSLVAETLTEKSSKDKSSSLGGTSGPSRSLATGSSSSLLSPRTPDVEDISVGVAFVEAVTHPPQVQARALEGKEDNERENLEYAEAVLMLLNAIVCMQTDASAIVENGLIPSLLCIVDMDVPISPRASSASSSISALRLFIMALSVQILENLIANNSAATTFHQLNGVNILIGKLHRSVKEILEETKRTTGARASPMKVEEERKEGQTGQEEMKRDSVSEEEEEEEELRRLHQSSRRHLSHDEAIKLLDEELHRNRGWREEDGKRHPHLLNPSQHILLVSLLNCLSTGLQAISAANSGGRLKEGLLSPTMSLIFSHIEVWGGLIFAVTATLLGDIINNDPSCLSFVHSSGLSLSFLEALGQRGQGSLPPVPELVVAIPTVLNALSLTTAGAEVVGRADPLRSLFSLFSSPRYISQSGGKCLEGDLSSIVGAGVDELLRQVPTFRRPTMVAAVNTLKEVRSYAARVQEDIERILDSDGATESDVKECQKKQEGLLEMVNNISQLLEPLLTKTEHAEAFRAAGGLSALLALCNYSIPMRRLLLLSTVEKKVEQIRAQSVALKEAKTRLALDNASSLGEGLESVCLFVLDGIPRQDYKTILLQPSSLSKLDPLADFFRTLALMEWLASLLLSLLKSANAHSSPYKEFVAELTTESTQEVLSIVYSVNAGAMMETARVAANLPLYRKEEGEKIGIKVGTEEDVTMAESSLTSPANEEGMKAREKAKIQEVEKALSLMEIGGRLLSRYQGTARQLLMLMSKIILSNSLLAPRYATNTAILSQYNALARFSLSVIAQALSAAETHLPASLTEIERKRGKIVCALYYVSILELSAAILFDERRQVPNTLFLKHFLQEGIVERLLQAVTEVFRAGVEFLESPNVLYSESEVLGTKDVTFSSDVAKGGPKEGYEDALKSVKHSLMGGLTLVCSFMKKIAGTDAILSSPVTASLLLSDPSLAEGSGRFDGPKFIVKLQFLSLQALCPLLEWQEGLKALPPALASSFLSAISRFLTDRLHKKADDAREGGGAGGGDNNQPRPSTRRGRGGRGFRITEMDMDYWRPQPPQPPPFQQNVQRERGRERSDVFSPPEPVIRSLVEMGFERRRVEHAFQQVMTSSIEAAMEYLLTHADDPLPPPPPTASESRGEAASGPASATATSSTATAPVGDASSGRRSGSGDDEQKSKAGESSSSSSSSGPPNPDQELEQRLETLYEGLHPLLLRSIFSLADAKAQSIDWKDSDLLASTAESLFLTKVHGQETMSEVIAMNSSLASILSLCYKKKELEEDTLSVLLEELNAKISLRPLSSSTWSICHLSSLFLLANPPTRERFARDKTLVSNLIMALREGQQTLSTSPWSGLWLAPAVLLLDVLVQTPPLKGNGPSSEAGAGSSSSQEEVLSDLQLTGRKTFRRSLLSLQQLTEVTEVATEQLGNKELPLQYLQALLQLLARLTRVQVLASKFLSLSGLDSLLSLSSSSRFPGSVQLITVLLRHVLEADAQTLQGAMETEIKSTLLSLGKKGQASPRVFLHTLTPVILRDPVSFFRACEAVVKVETQGHKTILSVRESETYEKSSASSSGRDNEAAGKEREGGGGKRTPSRSSLSRQRSRTSSFALSVAAQIMSELVLRLVEQNKELEGKCLSLPLVAEDAEKETQKEEGERDQKKMRVDFSPSFALDVTEILQLLADLVASFPSCSSALHRFSLLSLPSDLLPKESYGGSNPFIAFLMRNLLPAPRVKVGTSPKPSRELLASLAVKLKRSQQTSRLLIALASRPGEGRKRLIQELGAALDSTPEKASGHTLWLLHSLGELTLSLLTLHSSKDSSPPSLSNDSALAWDVLRLMVDHNITESLLKAGEKVDLSSTLSSSLLSLLLRPVEIMTRSTVVDRLVASSTKKEEEERRKKDGDGRDQSASLSGEGRDDRTGHEREEPELMRRASSGNTAMVEEGIGEGPGGSERGGREFGVTLREIMEDIVHGGDSDEEMDQDLPPSMRGLRARMSDHSDEEEEEEDGSEDEDEEDDEGDEEEGEEEEGDEDEDEPETVTPEQLIDAGSFDESEDELDPEFSLLEELQDFETLGTPVELEDGVPGQSGRRFRGLQQLADFLGDRNVLEIREVADATEAILQGVLREDAGEGRNAFGFANFRGSVPPRGRTLRIFSSNSQEIPLHGNRYIRVSRFEEDDDDAPVSFNASFPTTSALSTSSDNPQTHPLLALDRLSASDYLGPQNAWGGREAADGPEGSGLMRWRRQQFAYRRDRQNGRGGFLTNFSRWVDDGQRPDVNGSEFAALFEEELTRRLREREEAARRAAEQTPASMEHGSQQEEEKKDDEEASSPQPSDNAVSALVETLDSSSLRSPASSAQGEESQAQTPSTETASRPVVEVPAAVEQPSSPPSEGDRPQEPAVAGSFAQAGQQVESGQEQNVSPETREAAGQPAALVCPPGFDPEVFACLPSEMQEEVLAQHRAETLAASSAEAAGLDPEALAALPEDIRQEVLEQQERERRAREEQAAAPPADASHAQDMDNASFLATLTPDLREEVLLSVDEAFLSSLPANIQAEAQLLRERAVSSHFGTGSIPAALLQGGRAGEGRTQAAQAEGKSSPIGSSLPEGLDLSESTGGAGAPGVIVRRVLDLLAHLLRHSSNTPYFFLRPSSLRLGHKEEEGKLEITETEGEGAEFEKLIALVHEPLICLSYPNMDRLMQLLEMIVAPLSKLAQKKKMKPMEEAEEKKEEGQEEKEGEEESTPMQVEGGEHQPSASNSEEKKEGEEEQWVPIPRPGLSPSRVRELVGLLTLDICTEGILSRASVIISRLALIESNKGLFLTYIVEEAKVFATKAEASLRSLKDRLKGRQQQIMRQSTAKGEMEEVEKSRKVILGEEGGAKSSLPPTSVALSSSSSEFKLLTLLQTLDNLAEEDKAFAGCCAEIRLDPLWKSLEICLHDAMHLTGLQGDKEQPSASSSSQAEKKKPTLLSSLSSMGLVNRFLPMVEAFFVANAREAKSIELKGERKTGRSTLDAPIVEMVTTSATSISPGASSPAGAGSAPRSPEGKGKLSLESPTSPSQRQRQQQGAGDSPEIRRLLSFVEHNRVLLNLLVKDSPSLLDSSLSSLVKLPRCRAFLDFDNKRAFFRQQLKKMRQSASRRHGTIRMTVRRNMLFEDSFHHIRHRTAEEMSGRLQVTFQGEEGIDAGGLTREWYQILAREIFNPNYALFIPSYDSPTFQPNPLSYINRDHLAYFKFVGRVIGKAIADGQLLDAHFTRSFYKHILGIPVNYQDMEAIDPQYFKNLSQMLEQSVDDLCLDLTFSVETNNFGKLEVVDLLPGGRHIAVTDENKMDYIRLVTHHRMTSAIKEQTKAFLEGFHELVPSSLISIFNERELELLISGTPEIDIDDLKSHTEYSNYKATDTQIRWFWSVLYSLSEEEKALFLQFVTGTSKVPLEGFKALQGMRGTQLFNIHKSYKGENALPSAHTCFNQLDLPEYTSEDQLKERLLFAIREGSEGFGFG